MAAINATRGLTQVLASDEDAAALNALVPAVVRPAASVNDALAALFDDDGTGLSFSAFKIAGLPETTFIWISFWHSLEGAGCCIDMLYLREGQDPHFQLLLNMPRGDLLADVDEQEPEPELHLNRFRGLRARLRTALPALGRVSDPTLLALLCAMGANNVAGTVKHVAGLFAFTRLMKGHPQRGDGKPTAAERALAALCDGYGREEAGAPYDLGKRPGGDAALEPGCHLHMGWINVRGLCVPDAIVDGVRPALEKAVPLLDAFHRGA